MKRNNCKKHIIRGLICILATSVIAETFCFSGFAEEIKYGTVGIETSCVDSYEIVYENHFDAESDFTKYYNKPSSDYPIYPNTGTSKGGGGVKFTWTSDFKAQYPSFGNPKDTFMIRSYNGDSKKHSKGFWFDLDKVLEDNGYGTYKFSFTATVKSGHGLVEGCLNTLENQSDLGKILWNVTSQYGTPEGEDVVGGVNIGGHILCRRWDETGDLNQKEFESITYIPEDAEHLRFLFGGSVDYDSVNEVGGSGWNPIAMDDLVIYKKKSSAESGYMELENRVYSLDGNEHTGRLLSLLYDENNALVASSLSDEVTVDNTEEIYVSSVLNTSKGYDESYTVKTLFVDVSDHITPYGISYNPNESLFSDYSFETPLTAQYKFLKYAEVLATSSNAAYTGKKGIELNLEVGDTYFSVGEGEVVTKDGTSASTTALAKAVWENGAGKYRISFMAKTSGDDATVKAEVRRHIQSTKATDITDGNGKTEVSPHIYSNKSTVTSEWNEIQLDVDIYPMTPWGGVGEYVSYRRNNYPLKLIFNGTGKVFIDDFKVTKISEDN